MTRKKKKVLETTKASRRKAKAKPDLKSDLLALRNLLMQIVNYEDLSNQTSCKAAYLTAKCVRRIAAEQGVTVTQAYNIFRRDLGTIHLPERRSLRVLLKVGNLFIDHVEVFKVDEAHYMKMTLIRDVRPKVSPPDWKELVKQAADSSVALHPLLRFRIASVRAFAIKELVAKAHDEVHQEKMRASVKKQILAMLEIQALNEGLPDDTRIQIEVRVIRGRTKGRKWLSFSV